MATTLTNLAWMLISTELQSLRALHDRLPGRFAALLHEDEGARRAAVAFCEQVYDAVTFFEKVAFDDDWVSDYLSKLVWPANTRARETLIGLDECHFKRAPEDIRTNLEHSFTGFGRAIPA